ncbi:hypothetical protein SADUNF_Sadunf05G0143400 [Salix dunnii]|uniref:Uncharacterized protein n=1 Tax=Salix dunnii TaxID=1413687 RepID=A0A835MZI1_9ROSI|nr:hypothetical protein SADUNF_Sadunf05G0143400 [Salix dunnii]
MMHLLSTDDHKRPFNVQRHSFDMHNYHSRRLASIITEVLAMEKSKSFPQYSSSFSGEFGFEDRPNSYNFNGPCQKGNGFATSSDPELKRRKRIASYNVFTMEGKLKSNVRNSFKWIKSKFSDARNGTDHMIASKQMEKREAYFLERRDGILLVEKTYH